MSEQSQFIKPRAVVRVELSQRLKVGEDLLKRTIMNFNDLKNLESEMWEWHSYNTELAKRAFSPSDNAYYQEIKNPTPSPETLLGSVTTDRSIDAQLRNTKNEIRDRLKVLKHLMGKLDLIPVSKSAEISQNEKLHLILSYIVERFEKDKQECFSSQKISEETSSEMHINEVEYLCRILIHDNFVRDTSSQDSFVICTKDATLQAFYAKHYLNPNGRMENHTEKEVNPQPSHKINTDQFFIVHGHNTSVKVEVARTIERLGLTVIILHEQANAGLTVIEKFERHSKVGFAVVLLTDDDFGRAKKALYTPGVELTSDVSGILYTRLDEEGSWKTKLAKELIEAGFSVDVTKII